MRLFVAADLPPEAVGALAALAPPGDGWRPLAPEALHITLVGHVPDGRPYRPHVTLARSRGKAERRPLAAPPEPIAFRVRSMTLYRSETGSRYSAITRSTLRG